MIRQRYDTILAKWRAAARRLRAPRLASDSKFSGRIGLPCTDFDMLVHYSENKVHSQY